jgi:hypothetical protein
VGSDVPVAMPNVRFLDKSCLHRRFFERRALIERIFPNEAACQRLMTVILSEICKECQAGRDYLTFDEDSLPDIPERNLTFLQKECCMISCKFRSICPNIQDLRLVDGQGTENATLINRYFLKSHFSTPKPMA